MDPGVLDSQFATLEELVESIHVDISASPNEIVRTTRRRLGRESKSL